MEYFILRLLLWMTAALIAFVIGTANRSSLDSDFTTVYSTPHPEQVPTRSASPIQQPIRSTIPAQLQ